MLSSVTILIKSDGPSIPFRIVATVKKEELLRGIWGRLMMQKLHHDIGRYGP
jgi:hypothetical protein